MPKKLNLAAAILTGPAVLKQVAEQNGITAPDLRLLLATSALITTPGGYAHPAALSDLKVSGPSHQRTQLKALELAQLITRTRRQGPRLNLTEKGEQVVAAWHTRAVEAAAQFLGPTS